MAPLHSLMITNRSTGLAAIGRSQQVV